LKTTQVPDIVPSMSGDYHHILKIYDLTRPVLYFLLYECKATAENAYSISSIFGEQLYLVEFLLRKGCSVLKSGMLVVVGIKDFEQIIVVL
jgi:hypothetical protein